MGETGINVPYPRNLNPTAQEFTPTTTNPIPLSVAVGVPYPYPHFAVTPPPHLSTLPTRSVLLSPVPPTTESDLRKDLQAFGEVRAIQTDSFRYGIVTAHFYDLRHAQAAFTAIRTHHVHCVSFFNPMSQPQFHPAPPPPPPGLVAGVPLWAHYVFSDIQNQGTLVVFNLDDDVSPEKLRQVFEPFGAIKEVREIPGKKKSQRFVEFFDIRDAGKALKEMNGKEIEGKSIAIEFSKQSGYYGRRFFHSSNPNPNPNTYISNKPFHFNFPPPPPSPRRRFGPPQFSHKNFGTGSMSSNSLNGDENHFSPRRNFGREFIGERPWNWKGKQPYKNETRYIIKEDAIVESDSRTTLMIKNIPNKYSQKLLLNMLDNHCLRCNEQIGDGDDKPLSSYDFVYLPIDFKNKCNVGYGFVNMTSPEATLRFYKAFQQQRWEVFNSRKICHLTYARVQGLEALKEHFKNSKFPCEMEHYLPVVFSPPRDGKQLTEPFPVVGSMVRMGAVDDKMEGRDHRVVAGSSGGGDDDDDDKLDVK
ncbi:protein terminal ear1-like [Vicia villosa]|uniref:protein terminal ear1-like n=1 Tax=Vicia villosa TaxID=3911 RepID=UPI00273B4E8A|nr:protein terminal ear1-like [Vicia villosa]